MILLGLSMEMRSGLKTGLECKAVVHTELSENRNVRCNHCPCVLMSFDTGARLNMIFVCRDVFRIVSKALASISKSGDKKKKTSTSTA